MQKIKISDVCYLTLIYGQDDEIKQNQAQIREEFNEMKNIIAGNERKQDEMKVGQISPFRSCTKMNLIVVKKMSTYSRSRQFCGNYILFPSVMI